MRWMLLGLAVIAAAALVGLTAGQGAAVVLLLLAWATALLVARARLIRPASPLRWSRRPGRAKPLEDPALVSMQRRVFWASQSSRQFDLHLRPVLTRAASTLVADRTGLDLERDRLQVRSLLGAEAFDLIDPRRPPSTDDQPVGSLAGLDQLLDRLETL